MIDEKIIEEVKKRLVQVYNPLEVYLFGSYAWGTPTEDSDLDFLVVIKKSKEKRFKRAVLGHHALFGLKVPKDIIVYTEEEFVKTINDKNSLSYRVKNEGKKLYAKA